MSTCLAVFTLYNAKGRTVGGGELRLPDYLDWMPIEVKGFWFRTVGYGDPNTENVLLRSQGEQLLLTNVSLRKLTHIKLTEKRNGAEREVQAFIDREGYSRVPRNQ